MRRLFPLMISIGFASAAVLLLIQVVRFPSLDLIEERTHPSSAQISIALGNSTSRGIDLSTCDSLYLDIESSTAASVTLSLYSSLSSTPLREERSLPAKRETMVYALRDLKASSSFSDSTDNAALRHITSLSLDLVEEEEEGAMLTLYGASAAGAEWRKLPIKLMMGMAFTFVAFSILLWNNFRNRKRRAPRQQ